MGELSIGKTSSRLFFKKKNIIETNEQENNLPHSLFVVSTSPAFRMEVLSQLHSNCTKFVSTGIENK